MAKKAGVEGNDLLAAPLRTPGVVGRNDAGDPSAGRLFAGDGPGPTGFGPLVEAFKPKPIVIPKTPNRTVIGSTSADRPRRTRVTLSVIAHASPRWTSAQSAAQADQLNQSLSNDRERAVLKRAEELFRRALPDQQLVFEYAPARITPDPLDVQAPIDVDSKAIGSQQTLQEAGKRGRTANDPDMRRVELTIALGQVTDTDTVTTVKERQRISNATRDWALKVGVEMKVEEGVGGGGFNLMLKNRRSGQEVEGWVGFSTAGIGASLPIPTIDMGGYTDFTTRDPCTFDDFDGVNVAVSTSGFNALLFGYEWSYLYMGPRGQPTVEIDVGGFVMGGAGLDIGEAKYGALLLREAPETYVAMVVHDEHKYTTSKLAEESRHRVLFDTGRAAITPTEDRYLRDFIEDAVKTYQRPGGYRKP